MKQNIDTSNNEWEYIQIHSEVLNKINDEFWKKK